MTLTEFLALVDGITLLHEITPRSLDYLISFGERFSSKIFSQAVADLGKKTQPMTGREAGIVTDSNYGNCKPLMNTTRLRVFKNIESLVSKKIIPVIGGFSGEDQHGHVTTLGRGGSDYTASIIASCVKADEIWMMGDADGMMTADPSMVDNAKMIPEVSYSEAMEMSMFGAQQIHPKTFEPLLVKKIPMRVRNVNSPENPGTLILSSPDAAHRKSIKCVSAFKNNAIVDISGTNMAGAPGTAAKIFEKWTFLTDSCDFEFAHAVSRSENSHDTLLAVSHRLYDRREIFQAIGCSLSDFVSMDFIISPSFSISIRASPESPFPEKTADDFEAFSVIYSEITCMSPSILSRAPGTRSIFASYGIFGKGVSDAVPSTSLILYFLFFPMETSSMLSSDMLIWIVSFLSALLMSFDISSMRTPNFRSLSHSYFSNAELGHDMSINAT